MLCSYFDKTASEMFFEGSSIRQMIILLRGHFDWMPRQDRSKEIEQIPLKINSPETIWNIGLRPCRNSVCISLYKCYVVFFMAIAQKLWFVW